MFLVRNIKVSVKVKALILNNALNSLSEQNVNINNFGNFVSFKFNNFTYVLFKRGKRKDSHVNITQIPNFWFINKAIDSLIRLLNCEVRYYTVDNIIATTDLKRSVSFRHLIDRRKFKRIKYNSEVFPGLFIKFKKGTVIVFHTGKLVIVGCKSVDNIKWINTRVRALI